MNDLPREVSGGPTASAHHSDFRAAAEPMYAEERQQDMAHFLARHGRHSINKLAKRYAVSTETTRRDLDVLQGLGLVRRVHGGAIFVDDHSGASLAIRKPGDESIPAVANGIALLAASLVPPAGSTLLIEGGQITTRLAQMLPQDRKLVAYTHSVPVAGELTGRSNVELHILPGHVGRSQTAAYGSDTISAIRQLRVDAAFLCVDGLDIEGRLWAADGEEAAVKQAIIASARNVMALCYASMLGRESAVRVGHIEQANVLITDARPDDPHCARAAGFGVHVMHT